MYLLKKPIDGGWNFRDSRALFSCRLVQHNVK